MDGIIVAVIGLMIMAIIFGWITFAWITFARLRSSRAFQQGLLHGRLQGMTEAVDIFLGYVGYVEGDEPDPEMVVKAKAAMDRAFKLDHGIKGQITLYQIGITKLGVAVGLAVYHKGYTDGYRSAGDDQRWWREGERDDQRLLHELSHVRKDGAEG
jgi:hypothetical protein